MTDVAKIINDKWNAVFEMPAAAFLGLLRYRRDKVEYDLRRARQNARNNKI